MLYGNGPLWTVRRQTGPHRYPGRPHFLHGRDRLEPSEFREEPLGPRRPEGGGVVEIEVAVDDASLPALGRADVLNGHPQRRYSGGGVGAGIVVKGQSDELARSRRPGRSPAERGRSDKRRAWTPASTRGHCWPDDAHNTTVEIATSSSVIGPVPRDDPLRVPRSVVTDYRRVATSSPLIHDSFHQLGDHSLIATIGSTAAARRAGA